MKFHIIEVTETSVTKDGYKYILVPKPVEKLWLVLNGPAGDDKTKISRCDKTDVAAVPIVRYVVNNSSLIGAQLVAGMQIGILASDLATRYCKDLDIKPEEVTDMVAALYLNPQEIKEEGEVWMGCFFKTKAVLP